MSNHGRRKYGRHGRREQRRDTRRPRSPRMQRLASAISKRRGSDSERDGLAPASKIQFSILPEKIPNIPSYDMKVFYLPAQEIGGDFYDFIPIDRENLGIVIADVSGKGVPGAMIMTMARAVIRLLALGNPKAKETIIKANRFISRDIKNVMFLTLLYLVLNVRTRTLQVVNAGHNPLILWRDNSYRLINPSGIAVGFDLGPIFDQKLKDEIIELKNGDRVLVYTDGVVECMNEDGEEFGEERFLDIVMQHGNESSAEFINVLVNALTEHQGERRVTNERTDSGHPARSFRSGEIARCRDSPGGSRPG